MLAVLFLVLVTSCVPLNLLQSGLCPIWSIHHSLCCSPLTSIMLNSVDTLVLTCLNVVDISYCSSFLPETLPHLTCVFPWPLCFPTTSQAVPSHPSQQPSFLHWPLSCWYPPRLFLGALLSSFCVTLLGGFSFTLWPQLSQIFDNSWISESGLRTNMLPTCLQDIYAPIKPKLSE